MKESINIFNESNSEEEEFPSIQIIKDRLTDQDIDSDICCILDEGNININKWLYDKEKQNYIYHKGDRYKGAPYYPSVFIFKKEKDLDIFVDTIKDNRQALQGFELKDILNSLGSTYKDIRIVEDIDIKEYSYIGGNLCCFIDKETFNKKYGDKNKDSNKLCSNNKCQFIINLYMDKELENWFLANMRN